MLSSNHSPLALLPVETSQHKMSSFRRFSASSHTDWRLDADVSPAEEEVCKSSLLPQQKTSLRSTAHLPMSIQLQQQLTGDSPCVVEIVDDRSFLSNMADSSVICLRGGNTYQQLKKYIGHQKRVTCIVNIDAESFLSGSQDGSVKLWDKKSGDCLHTFYHPHPVNCIAMMDENRFMSCSNGRVCQWDIASRRCIKAMVCQLNPITSLVYIDEERFLTTSAMGNKFVLRNMDTGKRIRSFSGHEARVSSAVPVGNDFILSGSFDTTFKLWRMSTGECVLTSPRQTAAVDTVVSLGKGVVMTTLSDSTTSLWDVTYSGDFWKVTLARTVGSAAVIPLHCCKSNDRTRA